MKRLRGEIYGIPLSPREKQILDLYGRPGCETQKQVAHYLQVDINTIKFHMKMVMAKTATTTVLSAYRSLGLLKTDPRQIAGALEIES